MKKLFLTLAVAALAFTACNNNDPIPIPVTPPENLPVTVSAVSNAPGNLSRVDAVVENGATDIVIASQPYSGTFTLTLPGVPTEAQLLGLRTFVPPSGVNTSDVSAKYLPVEFRGYNATSTDLGLLTNEVTEATGFSEILYWYLDRDVVISGTNPPGTSGITTNYNLTLKKGWNRILRQTNATTNTVSYSSPVSSPTSSWVFTSPTPVDLVVTATSATGDSPADVNQVIATPQGAATPVIATATTYTPGASTFTMTLPAVPTDLSALEPFYEGSGDVPAGLYVSNIAAEFFIAEFRGNDDASELNGFFVNRSVVGAITTEIIYIYVDRDVTITGRYTDGPAITYNVRFHQGWNKMLKVTNTTLNTETFTSPVPGTPADNWMFVSAVPVDIVFTAVPFTGAAPTTLASIAATANAGIVTIADATYTAGTSVFTMTLPATPTNLTALDSFFDGTVPTGITLSDPAAEFFEAEFLGENNLGVVEGRVLNQVTNGTTSTDQILYWYVDRPVTITGSYTNVVLITYNTILKTGWNRVLKHTVTATGAITYSAPAPTTPAIGWIYVLNIP